MRVALGTIEVDDYARAALSLHYGDTGLASRDRVRSFVLSNGVLALDDVRRDYDEHMESVKENLRESGIDI